MRKSTRIILPVTDNHKNQLIHFLYRNASACGFMNHLCVVDSQRQDCSAILPSSPPALSDPRSTRQVCECKLKLNSLKERKQKQSSSILQVHTHIKTHSLTFICFFCSLASLKLKLQSHQ